MKKAMFVLAPFLIAALAGLSAPQTTQAKAVCSDDSYKEHYDENGDSGCFGEGSDCVLCWEIVVVDG